MSTGARTAGRPGRYDVRIGVLERLGIRHMDGWLAFSAVGLIALSISSLMPGPFRRPPSPAHPTTTSSAKLCTV